MALDAPEYRFVSRWTAPGTVEEVSDVLSDPGSSRGGGPRSISTSRRSTPGGERGVGRRVRLHTKGLLPYTLDWEIEVVASRHPHGFAIEATGDLAGRGEWSFEGAGDQTLVTYDWRVRAEKPLLRALSPLFRPLLSANHRWAMRRGEESLVLELARRRAATPAEKSRIPAPPAPADASPAVALAAGAILGLAVYVLLRRLVLPDRRPRRRRH